MNISLASLPLMALCVAVSHALHMTMTQTLSATASLCLLPFVLHVMFQLRRREVKRQHALVRVVFLTVASIALAVSSSRVSGEQNLWAARFEDHALEISQPALFARRASARAACHPRPVAREAMFVRQDAVANPSLPKLDRP